MSYEPLTEQSRPYVLTTAEKLKRIAKVLKSRFMNLTVDETLDLAQKIVEELERGRVP